MEYRRGNEQNVFMCLCCLCWLCINVFVPELLVKTDTHTQRQAGGERKKTWAVITKVQKPSYKTAGHKNVCQKVSKGKKQIIQKTRKQLADQSEHTWNHWSLRSESQDQNEGINPCVISSGLHCTEEGHKEDVRHEVHEQAEMCGAEWSEERLERAADHAEPRTSFPGQLLVSYPLITEHTFKCCLSAKSERDWLNLRHLNMYRKAAAIPH